MEKEPGSNNKNPLFLQIKAQSNDDLTDRHQEISLTGIKSENLSLGFL